MSSKLEKVHVFSRVYKRVSKSPYEDHSTTLWLAALVSATGDVMALNYDRYIYLHKASNGTICGISVGKKLLEDNPEFENRYMEGTLMYAFLLLHIDEICAFLDRNFREQFIEMYLLPPKEYFSIAEKYWLERISDA